MYEIPANANQPEAPAAFSVAETTRSVEEIVTFNLPQGAAPVKFGLAGKISPSRGSVSRQVLSLPGGKDVSLFSVELHAKNGRGETFRGRWASPIPTDALPAEMGYGGFGAIEDLPSELRKAVLALVLPTVGEIETQVNGFSRVKLEGEFLMGMEGYDDPSLELQPIDGGFRVMLVSEPGGRKRAILRSVVGLGDEYLIPTDSWSTEEVAQALIEAELAEEADFDWRGEGVLIARGKLLELTGVGFGPEDSRQD